MSAFKKSYIPLIGGLLVVVGFFLPWLSVGLMELFAPDLAGGGLNMSAFGLATLGRSSGIADFVPEGRVLLVLWVFLLIGLAILGLAIWSMRNSQNERTASMWQMFAGVLGLVLIIGPLVYLWVAEPELSFAADSLIDAGIGFWLTLIGLLATVIGGYLVYREAQDVYSQPTYDSGYTQTSLSGAGAELAGGGVIGGAIYQPPAIEEYSAPITLNEPAAAPPRRATEILDKRDPLAMAWLVMKDGPRAGHTFRLLEVTSIGRDAGNDIIIDDASLSGQHAKIKFEDGNHYVIYDLASTNGLFYYDAEKQDWVRDYRIDLKDGQQVKLGRTVLHFMAPNLEQSA